MSLGPTPPRSRRIPVCANGIMDNTAMEFKYLVSTLEHFGFPVYEWKCAEWVSCHDGQFQCPVEPEKEHKTAIPLLPASPRWL